MHSNEDRQIQEIKSEYVEQVKAKVEETFGAKSRDKVFNQIEDLLRDKQMVRLEIRDHLQLFLVATLVLRFMLISLSYLQSVIVIY